MASWSVASAIPSARIASSPSGSGVTSAKPVGAAVPRARRPHEPEDGVDAPQAGERVGDEPLEPGRVRRLQLEHVGRAGQPLQVLGEAERPAGVDAQRLERGPAAEDRLVVGA